MKSRYFQGGAFAGVLAIAILAGCHSAHGVPLWPGAKFTDRDRSAAVMRALAYIERSAQDAKNFYNYGSDYLFCFYSIADTAADPKLRKAAEEMGREAALRWANTNSTIPADATANDVSDLISGWYSASRLGQSDERMKPELRRAAARFSVVDYLQFDPAKEPPPSDIPARCLYDSTWNSRGSRFCRKCGRPLKMQSKYDIWMDALIAAYGGERYGIPPGSHYRDVLQWMPAMRPYLDRSQTTEGNYFRTIYALTHVVYTLNDYNRYRLAPEWLPMEYSYLRRNLQEVIALQDPETVGEFLDTLKSFGLNDSDGLIRDGTVYLLKTQRADGTWSDLTEKSPYTLYHSAWTGIGGLMEIRWQGESLSFPELRPLLEQLRWQRRGTSGPP